MRRALLILTGVCLLALHACSSSSAKGDAERMTYDAAVRQIGRPPTRAVSLPDGGLEATWETEVSEGTRHLVMLFDADRRLVSSRTETRPSRRR